MLVLGYLHRQQEQEGWCLLFKVSDCWVVSSLSPDKTVSAMPYDRIRWPWPMTPISATTRPFSASTVGTRSGCHLHSTRCWLGPGEHRRRNQRDERTEPF